jgi:hypothetical protein
MPATISFEVGSQNRVGVEKGNVDFFTTPLAAMLGANGGANERSAANSTADGDGSGKCVAQPIPILRSVHQTIMTDNGPRFVHLINFFEPDIWPANCRVDPTEGP